MGRTPRVPAELRQRPFSLHEARAAGISPSALRGKSWRRMATGIYCWTGFHEEPWHVLVAWSNRLPHESAFMGLSAAWLHGLDVDPCHPVEIIVPRACDVRSRMNLVVRHGDLSEVTTVRGLRATTLARTFRDLSRRLSTVELLVLADAAQRMGLGRFHEIAAPAESPMETRLRWLLINSGLPSPEVQTDLYAATGEFVGRADLYYRHVHLVIEFDGGNHRDRLVSDDRRQNLLVGAGYRILRFTTADVRSRPDAVVAQVNAALAPTLPRRRLAVSTRV
jgi:very-short-patch-repair endonuclease